MKSNILNSRVVLAALSICLSGCAGTIPVEYKTQSYMEIEKGKTSMGEFLYEPAEEGKVKNNQLQNTAVGQVFVAEDVSEYVRRATAMELQNAGVEVKDDAATAVHANVHKFLLDDLGYSIDWSYSVTYKVIKQPNGEPIFEKKYTPDTRTTGKFNRASAYTASVNKMILGALEQFMKDAKENGLFTQGGQTN